MKTLEELKQDFYKGVAPIGLFTSVNEHGENMIIDISKDFLEISTIQSNGWTRVNIFHKDKTVEEYFER